MQKKPRSSSAWTACVLPDPESPVRMTKRRVPTRRRLPAEARRLPAHGQTSSGRGRTSRCPSVGASDFDTDVRAFVTAGPPDRGRPHRRPGRCPRPATAVRGETRAPSRRSDRASAQPVPRRDLDQDGQAAARGDRHADERDLQAEQGRRRYRRGPGGRNPPAGSHRSSCTTSSTRFVVRVEATPNRSRMLMTPRPWTPPDAASARDMCRRRSTARRDLHRVVRDQPVSAHDEVEGALALSDAALADDEHAEPEDVHQHAMDHLADRKPVVEQRRDLGDRERCRHVGPQATERDSAPPPGATRSGEPTRP